MPLKPELSRNHNDLNLAARTIRPKHTYLTHIGHQLDDYWLDHPRLPESVYIAWDEARILLGC